MSFPATCRPTHRGQAVDATALNAAADPTDARAAIPYLIVPGYTPRRGWSGGLHPMNAARLERAMVHLRTGRASTVIVTGGAVHSPDNEALMMRQWLLAQGLEPGRILVEPCARHTTTNLRNAGRLILARGGGEAEVITNGLQDYYLGFPWRSSFHVRCLVQLGYRVGGLRWKEAMRVRFVPSAEVFRDSPRATAEGDP